MKMKMKNSPHRYYINRPRSTRRDKYSKYKKCLSKMMLYVLSNTLALFEVQLLKKLSNAEARLKKA